MPSKDHLAAVPQRYLTVNSACEFYGISRTRIYASMESGAIAFVKGADGRRRIPIAAMENFVRGAGGDE